MVLTTTTGSCDRYGMRLAWAAATHVGNVRHRNEDGFVVQPGLFAVADGMGGHEAGDVASALALEVCREYAPRVPLPLDEVTELLDATNRRVFEHATEHGPFGMGTTIVGLAIVAQDEHESLVVFSVGDSRAYHFAPLSGLTLLTHDHSVVQELIDEGRLHEDAAARHPERNVVTRAVGIERSVVGDFLAVPRCERSRLLLCSDGVSGHIARDELADVLDDAPSPGAAVAWLLERVLAGTAPDNATAVVVDVELQPTASRRGGAGEIGDSAPAAGFGGLDVEAVTTTGTRPTSTRLRRFLPQVAGPVGRSRRGRRPRKEHHGG